MKQCLVCGEPLDDHALKCSKGHSLFETERGKGFSEEERHIVEDMLRQSSRGYKDDEIVYLVDKIIKICRDAGSRVTKALVETIGSNIENRHQQRQSKIRPTWPRPGSGEERQQQEAIARAQRRDRENTARREHLLNIEDGLPVFRGINDRGVSREDLTELLADAVNVLVYDRLRYPRYPDTTAPVGHVYNDNQSFWDDALGDRLVQGMRIRLARFHLMEWIPSAPGRYFTHEAKRAREEAKRYLMFEREYLPLGKQNMVLGGIGSIRLGASAGRLT